MPARSLQSLCRTPISNSFNPSSTNTGVRRWCDTIPSVEKNNQPLILGIVVIGAVLIISLTVIFTRNDSQPQEATENNVASNEENGTEVENGEVGQQPSPEPQPSSESEPIPTPQPRPGVLSVWDSLSVQEKTDLNPFDCDHETQWVSAEDGSCLDKPTETPMPPSDPRHPDDVVLSLIKTCANAFGLPHWNSCFTSAYLAVKNTEQERLNALVAWYKEEHESKSSALDLEIYEYDDSNQLDDYLNNQPLAEYSTPIPGTQLLIDLGFTDCKQWQSDADYYACQDPAGRIMNVSSYDAEADKFSGYIVVGAYLYAPQWGENYDSTEQPFKNLLIEKDIEFEQLPVT